MNLLKLFVAATFGCTMFFAHAAGFRLIEVPNDNGSPTLRGAVWFPCTQPLGDVKIGPYVMSVAKDCPVVGSKFPLVVISHGWSGTFLSHRDIAEKLANSGFVVAAINHGDNAMDPRRLGDLSVLMERPDDIKRLIDFMLGTWPDAQKIDPENIGFFGFSRGGYTGLVVAGANPLGELCRDKNKQVCKQVKRHEFLELTHDSRIKAAAIADPLSNFFTAESFKDVRIPIQIWRSEHGGDGVDPASVAAIAHALPAAVEFHTVPASQHFDFLPPCPPEMVKRAPEICSDRQSFDRASFHKEFDAQVLAFFRKNLITR